MACWNFGGDNDSWGAYLGKISFRELSYKEKLVCNDFFDHGNQLDCDYSTKGTGDGVTFIIRDVVLTGVFEKKGWYHLNFD
jgi:hypothetical protein